jgi:hypothetical protein
MAREGRAGEIDALQKKWAEERLPIPPAASGWTCERLTDETFAAWAGLNGR